MSNLTELLPAGGSGKTVDFVASGALPNGKPVILKADGTVEVVAESGGATNLTADNFLGTSTEAYADTDTATILLQGGISTNQSGLTIGSDYYVQEDGTLATTADTISVKLGKALSATTVLLSGE